MIEAAENVLRDLGFYDVRVRHHELRSEFKGPAFDLKLPRLPEPKNGKSETLSHLARIEVGPEEMHKFLENGTSFKIAEAIKQVGYAHVTLDLLGYRRGSLNEKSVVKSA